MLFFNVFFIKLKKKMYAWCFVFCFFVLCFNRLEQYIETYANFVLANWSEPNSVQRTVEIDDCENYFKQLNKVLYFEKHDSDLVKHILLWGVDESPHSYARKITLLMGMLDSVVVPDTVENNIMQLLNYYRLGFCCEVFVRNAFYFRCRSLLIKNEQQFKQTLVNMVDLYKTRYPCDEADEKRFQELINYEWTDQDIKYADFSKIKY